MAARTTAAKTAAKTPAKAAPKTDVAGRRVKKAGEPALAAYADKNIPTRITEFVDFLKRETGYDVDPRSVYLGSALRGTFQKSDENQERIAARAQEIVEQREAREARAEERAAKKVEREAARAAKAEEKAAAAKAAKEAPKAAPAKAAGKTTAKKAPAKTAAKAATPTRRRPARAAKETNADF
ncbi:hypothetical protein SEA_RIKSENGUPTA_45 [Microbacterium phage RikSengupta]|nr:hypothetical protein SEA_RIKSENGUPTA_45 [Microbacterium phage RikSengupta]